ncbi:transcriptional regulator with XRE-family HTH domain [Pedobacter cryoconitis]|uniref:helix-turn-helix domain-containing protein n=1 Tax=Pedobacter cryoconitis TaxID=188932 RepID=UPI0016159FF4|nr:helix-turn-helix transcriptional regulator [Pedobacter cryoconitis]MBB6271864.1 transcriptional regulator with XRE-family HTH domain [Pedobacter cryoconitis]
MESQALKIEEEAFLKALGQFFQRSRKEAGYKNANTFANVIGMSESQYRLYERGQANIKIKSLLTILKGLNKPFDVVFNIGLPSSQNSVVKDVFINESIQENQVRNQVVKLNGAAVEESLSSDDVKRLIKILISCFRPLKKSDILKAVGLSAKTAKFSAVFNLLLDNTWIAKKFPEKSNSPKQIYFITDKGKNILKST